MPILTKYRKPNLPDGLFVLVLDAEMPNAAVDDPIMQLDGPFDGGQAVRESDGTLVLLTEGLPYLLKVESQDGPLLGLDGYDAPVRIEPWPLSR